jgi:prefoldin subunit 5
MFSETDERNAWLALKSTANRLVREIEALNATSETLQENIATLETIRTERGQMSLPDKMMRRGMYSENSK